MYCQHCGHKLLPPEAQWPHVCDDKVKAGKLKKLVANFCTSCGEPIADRPYNHQCGAHQLRDYWAKQN